MEGFLSDLDDLIVSKAHSMPFGSRLPVARGVRERCATSHLPKPASHLTYFGLKCAAGP
jgi:hypothetical protein